MRLENRQSSPDQGVARRSQPDFQGVRIAAGMETVPFFGTGEIIQPTPRSSGVWVGMRKIDLHRPAGGPRVARKAGAAR